MTPNISLRVVVNGGRGATPVPDDALLQPGALLNVIDANDGSEAEARVLAVVPVGVPIEHAVADQNDQDRPLMFSEAWHRSTMYVLDIAGRYSIVSQEKIRRGLTAACPDCLGTGRGDAVDPDAECETCSGAGRRDRS